MFAQMVIVIVVLLNIIIQQVNSAQWTYSNNCVILLYESCDNINNYVQYYFISTNNVYDQPIKLDPQQLVLPNTYNITATTKVLIHGYGGAMDVAFPEILKAYSNVPDLNIIIVDWKKLSDIPCYVASVIDTWQVGQCTATLLTSLLPYGISPKSIHLIGFSLGAHVAGITGTLFSKANGKKIGRITGLDPALPLYATLSFVRDWILDAGDSDFVDIIHTNSGVFGKIENTGDVDFYLNGGSAQPTCINQSSSRLCSHFMSPIYFSESITSNVGFYGKSCPSYYKYLIGQCNFVEEDELTYLNDSRIMGEYCNSRSRGVYFVKTANQSPFALGPYE